MLFYFHKIDFAYTLADDKAKLIKNSFSAAIKSQITHFFRNPEREIRIFVQAEPGFGFSFRIVPDGGIFFGVFSHGLQLAEVGGYGLVLYDIYLSQPVYYRAVAPGAVMVETQDALAFGSDAYHVEGHALADGGQVEHIAVGGEERKMMRIQKTPDAS